MGEDEINQLSFGELVNLPSAELCALLNRRPELILQADHHGRTLLNHAAEVGRDDVATYLVQQGADVNAEDDTGRTPLHWAANYGYLQILDLLLRSGGNTEIVDNGGLTPLKWAQITRSGHRAEAVALIERYQPRPS